MTESRKVVLTARSPRTEALLRWRDVHHWATDIAKDGPPLPDPLPANNVVEITEVTHVEQFRSDGRRMPGTGVQTTERVVYSLHVNDVPHLIAQLSRVLIDAVDSRTWAQAQQPVPAVDQQP